MANFRQVHKFFPNAADMLVQFGVELAPFDYKEKAYPGYDAPIIAHIVRANKSKGSTRIVLKTNNADPTLFFHGRKHHQAQDVWLIDMKTLPGLCVPDDDTLGGRHLERNQRTIEEASSRACNATNAASLARFAASE